MKTLELLTQIRDGWAASLGDGRLIPGPFLSQADIDALESSAGWSGLHMAEAVRRAFAPFCDRTLNAMCADRTRPGTGRPPEFPAILAGRIPALAAKVLFHGVAAGVCVCLKPSSAEPVFSSLLTRSALAVDPDAAVSPAPSSQGGIDRLIVSAPVCLVYGSDATVESVRRRRPTLPTLTGPHMESFVVIFASAIQSVEDAAAIASAVALDTAIYDQDGCLSPVAVLVQEGGAMSPAGFAATLVDRMAASPLKPGRIPMERVAAVRMFVQESLMLEGPGAILTRDGVVPPVAIMTSCARPGPGARSLQVIGFDGPGSSSGADRPAIPDLLTRLPHLAGRVQGLAAAGTADEVEALLTANPAYRPNYLCDPGRLQDPPALWLENGIVLCDELRKTTA